MKIESIKEQETRRRLDELFEQDDDALMLMEDEELDDGDYEKYSRKVKKSFDNQETERDIERFEEGLEELSLLAHAMENHDFGVIINKRSDQLEYNDILSIKRRIHDILSENPVLDGVDVFQPSPKATLKMLSEKIQSGASMWASFIIADLFAWTSVGFFAAAGVSLVPIVSLIGGALLSGLFFRAGIKQYQINKSIKNAAKVMSVTSAWKNLDVNGRQKRGKIKKFFDSLMMKSPAKIKKEAMEKIEKDSEKAAKRFDKVADNMPETIAYWGEDGKIHDFPVSQLFVK